MSGTKLGGRKAAATNKKKYGAEFYVKIGSIGGKAGHTGGFYANRELASRVGRIGGKKSKRGKKIISFKSLSEKQQKQVLKMVGIDTKYDKTRRKWWDIR